MKITLYLMTISFVIGFACSQIYDVISIKDKKEVIEYPVSIKNKHSLVYFASNTQGISLDVCSVYGSLTLNKVSDEFLLITQKKNVQPDSCPENIIVEDTNSIVDGMLKAYHLQNVLSISKNI